ncbi:alpha/beta hydrolase [Silvanigrella aquatica]|uniref:Serine aminopeptidase S33 domain-containing protein n=1 Tax=Silvanigrella aquatica TaxID=1915309 RepID=A0A1L4CWV0_9BACT|nr:alpha/beta hydrolase [Silvanigrella aquatica]APJ02431.1 hypothetical protein AXG55_00150 [Silvanigrella aquatica]
MTLFFRNIYILIILLITFNLMGCNHLFYYPDSEVRFTPEKFNLKFDNITIETNDDNKLNGWLIHAKNKKPIATIIHFHGNAENITTHFMYLAWLTNKGFDIIEFDYRGYGSSTGTPSRNGLFLDAKTALQWARRNSKTKDIFIIAQSLGGAVALPAYADNPIEGVQAIIIDSSFASYRKITRQKLSSIWLTWPLQWPLSFLVSDELSPVDTIQSIHVPLLFIHSPNDPVVPFESGKELYDTAPNPKELWEIEWGGHCSAFVYKDDLYRKKLVDYLCQHLSTPSKICTIDKEQNNSIDLKP